MRKILSCLAMTCLVSGLWGAGAATDAASNRTPAFRIATNPELAPVAIPVVQTDADRRARLNARLLQMVHEKRGGRLFEPQSGSARPTAVRARSATSRQNAGHQNATRQYQSAANGQIISGSTVLPPAARSAALQSTGGYSAPYLDLVTAPVVPTNAVECLTQAVYYEARNESEEGQAAVAEVVLNRSRTAGYPQDVCRVVYQRNSRTCQFTFTCDGSIGRGAVNLVAWTRAERIARTVAGGQSKAILPPNSVNYHANYVRPSWGSRLERVRQIGAHIFYGAALGARATPGAEPPPASEKSARGLQFVRIEAIDRSFAQLTAQSTQAQ